MTAEIAVMNRVAIALAADSATTTFRDDPVKQEKTAKIFNSADKLFQLDATSPIGVMVYNASSFMGVPWETVIKLYRKYSAGPQDHVRVHAEDFLKFLASDKLLTEAHIDEFFGMVAQIVVVEVHGRIKKAVASTPSPNFQNISRDAALDAVNQVKQRPLVVGLNESLVGDLTAHYGAKLDAIITSIFGSDDPGADAKNLLKELVTRFHIVEPIQNNLTTGLVIAGFGQAELYPSLWSVNIGGLLFNRKLQMSKPGEAAIGLSGNARVIPFAQAEVATSFLTGIQKGIKDHCVNTISSLLNKFMGRFVSLATPMISQQQVQGLQQQLGAEVPLLAAEFGKHLDTQSQTEHVAPVMAAVAVLPKDQLAVMAESLVALTSFRRRMSSDLETVGGAIDVAVISKGDGFVWIKRKHYFDPSLNIRYTERLKTFPSTTPPPTTP
jgi:hypothetical protein